MEANKLKQHCWSDLNSHQGGEFHIILMLTTLVSKLLKVIKFCVNHRLMIRSFFTGKKHHSLTFPYTNQLLKTRDFHLTLRLKLIESILCIIRHHKTKTIIVRKPEEFPPIKSHAIIIYHPVPPKMTNHWKQNRKLLS